MIRQLTKLNILLQLPTRQDNLKMDLIKAFLQDVDYKYLDQNRAQ